MKALDLKPCPFCGGKASVFRVILEDGTPRYEVDCENIDCEISACTSLHATRQEAADVWNKRWEPDRLEATA